MDPDGCEPFWATAMEVANTSTKAKPIQIVLRFFIFDLDLLNRLVSFKIAFFAAVVNRNELTSMR